MTEDNFYVNLFTNDISLLFFDWLTYGYAPLFIAAMCLFWLPRLTLSLGAFFLIYWVVWTSILDNNISKLMQTEISMTVADIHSNYNVAISNGQNCGWFDQSCKVYEAINKLLDENVIFMEDGTNIANNSSQLVVLNLYPGSESRSDLDKNSDSELEAIERELKAFFDQLSDSEKEDMKQGLIQFIKILEEMEAQGKTHTEIEAYVREEADVSMQELSVIKEFFGL